MTQQQSQEFLNLIASLIGEEHSDKVSEVSEILTQYIKNSISFEEASDRFTSLFGTNEAFKKIDDILKKIKTSDPSQYQSNPNNPNSLNIPSQSLSNIQPQVQPQAQPQAQNNPPSLQPQLQHPYNLSIIPNKISPLSGFRKKARNWTPEEDQRLINAINANGTENWPLVTSLVGGDRTRSQCSQRWHRVLDPKISKNNWSREEEQKLLNAVQEYGNKAWTRIASEMGNRSDVQCRFRYKFLLKKAKENQTELAPISASQDTLNQVQSVNMPQLQLSQFNNISTSSIQEDQIQLADQIKLNDPSQVPFNISLQLTQENQKDSSNVENNSNQNNDDDENSHNQNNEGQNENPNESNQS